MPEPLSPPHSPSGYRSDIDGLRAIAILSVLLYHVGLGVPGGFIGVDIFFVISGFLITGILKHDLKTEQFPLRKFWERRARRILPAGLVTLALTLAAAYVLMVSEDFKSTALAAASQAVFASNFYFWKTINYFTDASGAQPLLHMWSLAVEEQFYLVFPLVLLLLWKVTGKKGSRLIPVVLAAAAALSFAASAVGVFVKPKLAFYLLPTRAWELLIGGLLAWISVGNLNRTVREVLAWVGAALIAVPLFLYSDKTPFPGLAALAPCLGTALVILAGGSSGNPTSLGRLLSLKPVVFVGLISYSLYLFHWPALVLTQYALGPLSLMAKLVLVAAVVILSALSWRFIEQPVRRKQLFKSRNSAFVFAAVSIVLAAGAGAAAWKWVPGRFHSEETLVYRDVKERTTGLSIRPREVDSDKVRTLGVPDPNRVDVLIWGDSHARAMIPALDVYAKNRNLSAKAITYSNAPPLVHVTTENQGEPGVALAQAVARYVARHKVKDVIFAGIWTRDYTTLGAERFQALLRETAARLSSAGARVWVLLDVPNYDRSVPRRLVYDAADRRTTDWQWTPERYTAVHGPVLAMLNDPQDKLIHFLDPRPQLLEPDGKRYQVQDGGVSLYYDAHHLTAPGAVKVFTPMLEQQFTP